MRIKKKLLKNSSIQNILGFLTFLYISTVKFTSSFNYVNQSIPEEYWKKQKPFIMAFWHGQLLMIGHSWKADKRINILASSHSDGRFGAIVGRYFNLNNIPTRTNNKKTSLRPIYELVKNKNYIGITPDGPRGPKETVSEGVIKIAKSLNIPIIPIGFWSSKNFKLKSWDSFLITMPFSKCSFVWNEPLIVPNNISDDQIPYYQKLLEKIINQSVKKAKSHCR